MFWNQYIYRLRVSVRTWDTLFWTWVFPLLLATLFFSIVKVFVMTWFCVEHVTSILENLAVIDGKPKDALIKQVGILWVTVTDKFRKKADETEG